ncbi:MAG TPA: DUF1631 family protein [Ramlibacter sp.]|uniref:DUF1631 family protein n=1 Tax=Ramlibacter sp. TaxID=1917967 RepID=UPI002C23E289|nr:DUF1631 family protein [Ramlibacter sp.]HVZ46671.1 DUF1631 family protein [Ramlibacter sp.]
MPSRLEPHPDSRPHANSQQALYRAIMKDAASQGRLLIERTIHRAVVDMPALAQQSGDIVERGLLNEAARVLAKHEAQLVEAYPQALLAEFAHAIAGDTRKAGVSFDSLELMGDEQVQESVEMMRAQQAVLRACESELAALNALVSAVQGLGTVQPGLNPLRPESYVRALRQVVQQSPVSASVRRRWTTHLATAMGPELAACYGELSQKLRSQGVVDAGFVAAPTGEPTPVAKAAAEANTSLNVRELRRLLSGDSVPPGSDAASSNFAMTMPAAFETLQEMRELDTVAERLQQRRAAGAAQSPDQALAQEVVALMVENIASDARLLEPVREAVRELEPALKRLAEADPRFFSDKAHPARRLLEEMTQRSLAWTSVDAPGFAAFHEPLRQAVDALAQTRLSAAEPFAFALQTLHEAWGEAEKRERRQREKAVRALMQAEQRNLLAGRIAGELSQRADVAAAPPEIGQFLAGPWSQVIAQARLAPSGEAGDAQAYTELVADLVWSARPDLAGANPARLARLVPPLVERLERGLKSIDYPPADARRFLDVLASLHERALGREPGKLTREALEARLAAHAPADSWLAPLEARESGFMKTHTSLPQPLFEPTQPLAADPPPSADGPELPEVALQPGAWVEIFEGRWVRWQLTWASPHGTLFLFTHPDGRRQSMTRRLVHKLLAAGSLRLVSSQAVVAGALDAVAQAALRNSADL